MSPLDHEFSNKTKYSIESDAVRYTWAGYFLFVILSSLIGDITILVAAIKYNAIKLHRTIITVIQHIALCDLLVVTTNVLPRFATITANQWLFGELLCYCGLYISFYLGAASNLLICAMTISKLLLLRFPLQFGTISIKKAHMFCGIFWGIALVAPVLMLVIDWKDVHFSYTYFFCGYGFSSETWKEMGPPLITTIITLLPTFVVVITSVCLLIIARRFASRSREGLKWQGIVTTLLTAIVFCISLLPIFVSDLLVVSMGAGIKNKGEIIKTSYRMALTFLYLNTCSNFYIYCLTVNSFRHFVFSRLQHLFQNLNFSTVRGMKKQP